MPVSSEIERRFLEGVLVLLQGEGDFRAVSNGGILIRELENGCLDWVGLGFGFSDALNEYSVTPTVGVRHQAVHRKLAAIRGGAFRKYSPPTLAENTGNLLRKEFRKYRFQVGGDLREACEEVCTEILGAGRVFWGCYRSLGRVLARGFEMHGAVDVVAPFAVVSAWEMGLSEDDKRAVVEKWRARLMAVWGECSRFDELVSSLERG